MLAAITATILRRDSAATRHLVWLLAMVAMLVVPVLSAMLPEWRVLPEWAGISLKPVVVDFRLSHSSFPPPPSVAVNCPRVSRRSKSSGQWQFRINRPPRANLPARIHLLANRRIHGPRG